MVYDSPCFLELYIKNGLKLTDLVENILAKICVNLSLTNKFFNPKYNYTFDLFCCNLTREDINRVKARCLEINRFDIIKMFTDYTSPFSNTSKLSV